MSLKNLTLGGGLGLTTGGGNTSQNIGNLNSQGDSTQAFIDCIMLYAKNLEADAVSIEL
jgi:hypothetical protein